MQMEWNANEPRRLLTIHPIPPSANRGQIVSKWGYRPLLLLICGPIFKSRKCKCNNFKGISTVLTVKPNFSWIFCGG